MHPLCQYEDEHQMVLHIEDCDAICCALCNEWLETTCTEPYCEYCTLRPVKPLSDDNYQNVLSLIERYSRSGLIPPNKTEVDTDKWYELYDRIYNLIIENLS